jgi:hypothetical protein
MIALWPELLSLAGLVGALVSHDFWASIPDIAEE